MPNPTTRTSTPPQSGRIAQQAAPATVVLQGYNAAAFPAVAYVNQVAVNLDQKALAYFDANGVWQSVLGGADTQSFYGSVTPSGASAGDRWFNTTALLWYHWNAAQGAWMPGDLAYSDSAPAAPIVGEAWFQIHTRALTYWNGSAWVAGTDPTAPGVYTGAMPAAATAGSAWTDTDGIVWGCDTGYTGGTGAGKWSRWAYRVDPLAKLVLANGSVIVTGEATSSPPTPAVVWSSVTLGLVWLDTQAGANLGKIFVWNGTTWKQVYAPKTIDLCLALIASVRQIQFRNTDSVTAAGPGQLQLLLTKVPLTGSLQVWWNGIPQPPTEWSVSSNLVTIPDTEGRLKNGHIITAYYAYVDGVVPPVPGAGIGWASIGPNLTVTEGDMTDYSGLAVADEASPWVTAAGPVGHPLGPNGGSPSWPPVVVDTLTTNSGLWLRRTLTTIATATLSVTARVDGQWWIYVDGTLLASNASGNGDFQVGPYTTSVAAGTHVIALHVNDDTPDPAGDYIYGDMNVTVT